MATQDMENSEESYEESSINITDTCHTNLQKLKTKRPQEKTNVIWINIASNT